MAVSGIALAAHGAASSQSVALTSAAHRHGGAHRPAISDLDAQSSSLAKTSVAGSRLNVKV